MDILINLLISYGAVSFVAALAETFLPPKFVRNFLVAPLSIGSLYLLGLQIPVLIIAGLAISFFSVVTLHFLKPLNGVQVVRRR